MELLHGEAVTVIDLRGPEAFGGAHITGAVNIGAGAVLPMEVTSIVSFGPMSALHRAVMPSNFVQDMHINQALGLLKKVLARFRSVSDRHKSITQIVKRQPRSMADLWHKASPNHRNRFFLSNFRAGAACLHSGSCRSSCRIRQGISESTCLSTSPLE